MNESVIDVLIYLYEHYMGGDSAVPDDQILLEEELVQAGFRKLEIKKAFDWLDELAWRQGSLEYRKGPNQSIRVYTEDEQERLDVEIQGLLLYLEQNGILDPFSRELVIERAMALDTHELSVDDVKWIALLVLMNQPDQESALELMEEFVYHGDSGTLH